MDSGRQVRQISGSEFTFAYDETPCQRETDRHRFVCESDMLLVYEKRSSFSTSEGPRDPAVQGADYAQDVDANVQSSPVACFKAPQPISALNLFDTTICIGCEGGAVCFLKATFLAVLS